MQWPSPYSCVVVFPDPGSGIRKIRNWCCRVFNFLDPGSTHLIPINVMDCRLPYCRSRPDVFRLCMLSSVDISVAVASRISPSKLVHWGDCIISTEILVLSTEVLSTGEISQFFFSWHQPVSLPVSQIFRQKSKDIPVGFTVFSLANCDDICSDIEISKRKKKWNSCESPITADRADDEWNSWCTQI